MSSQRTNKGPKSPRFSLPEEGKELKRAWTARNLLDQFQKVLASGVQAALPSTEDVIYMIKEVLLLAKESLSIDHWDNQRTNPEVEVGETDTDVEAYAIAIDPSTGLPIVKHDPEMGDSTAAVVTKPTATAGTVVSKVRHLPRIWQTAREPTQLFSFLEGVQALLILFDQHSPRMLKVMRAAADALTSVLQKCRPETAEGIPQGARRCVEPRLGGLTQTIASLANYARRQGRQRKGRRSPFKG
jgi:hypothetical protein